jgi:Tol biopolymer transport system component
MKIFNRSVIVAAAVVSVAALSPVQREAYGQNLQLTWVDRTGKAIETVGPPGPYRGPDLSPDGKRFAVHRHEGNGGDAWVFDSGPGPGARLIGDGSNAVENSPPIWSPDGARIVFGSTRNGKGGLYMKRADGSGAEELLIESEPAKIPMSWSPDGQYIIYWSPGNIEWVLPLNGDRKPFQLSAGQSSHSQISPDGKWVAYLSSETGRGEVYIKPFPTGSGKWQVSKNGGLFARWRRDGKELYFLTTLNRGQMMAAEIGVTGGSIQVGEPRTLFESGYVNLNHPGVYHTFAVSADGERFLIPRPDLSTTPENARTLTLFDREGKIVGTVGEPGQYNQPVFSPDRSRVAVIKNDPAKGVADLWVLDVATGKGAQLTSSLREDPAPRAPAWSPDGKYVAYVASRSGTESFYRRAANAEGPEELLYKLPGAGIQLTDWSLDGRYLSYYSVQLGGNILFALPLEGERKPIEAARSDFQILAARMSPDSRLLAYRSNESGRNEIWVRSFNPAGGANADKWQVSTDGGLGMVAWRADGKELYYLGPDRGVMAVNVRTESGFEFSKPRLLFKAPDSIPIAGTPGALASVSRDGERILFAVPPPPPPPPPLQQITVLDRQGKTIQTLGEPGRYVEPVFSPDGARVAVRRTTLNSNTVDIFVFDLATGKSTPIATGLEGAQAMLWSPDGSHVLYVSTRMGGYQVIVRRKSDGSGSEELLYRHTPGAPANLNDISPDGQTVTFGSGGVIFILPLTGTDPLSRKPIEYLRDEYFNNFGRFSPDGRSIAYVSDESGRPELYVRPFDPSTGVASEQGKRKLTSDGSGVVVSWRADGQEIYYRKGDLSDSWNMAVDATAAAGAQPTPRYLFRTANTTGPARNISRDGQKFVVVAPVTTEAAR